MMLMIQLAVYEALGGWEHINEQPSRLMAVTAEDIQRVAQTYFDRTNRSVAIYTRKAGSEPEEEDPALASLPASDRAGVKQMLQQFEAVEDPAQLEMIRAQIQAQQAQVPDEYKPVMAYIVGWLDERIEKLRSETKEN
jgi:hypothetical protein